VDTRRFGLARSWALPAEAEGRDDLRMLRGFSLSGGGGRAQISQFYHSLDQDGKGFVTLKELQHYFEQTGLRAQVMLLVSRA
jgi:hypothetical protein